MDRAPQPDGGQPGGGVLAEDRGDVPADRRGEAVEDRTSSVGSTSGTEASASPATGSSKRHADQQAELIAAALAR